MIPRSPSSTLPRILRLLTSIAAALALVALLVQAFAPAGVALGDTQASVQLAIDKKGPITATAGSLITYTIDVTNNSGVVLGGVVVTDSWNTQLYTGTYAVSGDVTVTNFLLFTQTQPSYAQFNLQDMPIGARARITINMVISPGQQPLYSRNPVFRLDGNSAIVTSTANPSITVNSGQVDTLIVGPVLKLTKTVTPNKDLPLQLRPGRLFTYTFRLDNLFNENAIPATGIVITERLPNNTVFYTGYPPSLVWHDNLSNMVYFTLTDSLPVSESTFLTLTVRVTPTVGNFDINNLKINCGVRSNEIPQYILCDQDANTKADDVFEKTTWTVSPPAQSGPISKTFPNRILTYTVSVYNPFDYPVAGMIVTDVLPKSADTPEQTFQYVDLIDSSPPTLPTVVSSSFKLVSWQLPAIQALDVYTFAFHVFVPPQMKIDDNGVERQYQNKLEGSFAGMGLATNDGGHDDSMKVRVVRQIEFVKTVTPTTQVFGKPVTYTLVISNNGPTTIRNIVVTDVLPTAPPTNWCGFWWNGYVSGLMPTVSPDNSVLTWNQGITVPGYSQFTVGSFRATVRGWVGATCRNTVEGYSPDTYIVRQTQLAPVVVQVPFAGLKTVNVPSVVLGGSIDYSVMWSNVGEIPATADYFRDDLPSGFFYQGQPFFLDNFGGTPLPLLPHGAPYQRTFSVDVTSTNECDNLPKDIFQERGYEQMHIISPTELAGTWINADKEAGVKVYPHVTAIKSAFPPGAVPSETITFTVVLSNNTAMPISGVRVTDTLPNGFTYVGAVIGFPAPDSVVSPNVIWINQTVPANGLLTFAFTASAPSAPNPNLENKAKATSDANPVICVPQAKFPVPVKYGVVEVVKTTSPSPLSVGPLEVFQYKITLKNNGPYTVTVQRFTETLPGFSGYQWTYDSMAVGDPLPDVTNPHRPVWTNLTIGKDKSLDLRVNVRTSTVVGTFKNYVASIPPAGAGAMTATLPAGWSFTRTSNYNDAPVTVVPGVALLKEVDKPAAFAGETVVYTITLGNASGGTINNVLVTDTLPSGFVFQQLIGGDASLVTVNPLVFSLGSVTNQAIESIVFRVSIPATQTSGTYYNQVFASADSLAIAPTGNIAPVVVAGIPSLNIGKSVTPGSVIAGRDVTYTLSLVNPGDDDVIGARITDTLPISFSYVQMITGTAPSIVSQQLVWTGINVAAHTSTALVFRAHVDSGATDGTYFNRLDGSTPQVVFQSTGPAAPVVVVATPTFDVQVSKSDGAITGTIGGTTVYTIRYTNTLNTLALAATNVVLTETFAPASYLIPDAPGWNLVGSGVYTRLIGNLAAGASGSVTFALQIDAGIPEQYVTITNTVQIGASPPDDVPEAVEQPASNNTSTDIDTIRGSDIVVVGLTVMPSNPRQGQPITVAVTFMNQGVDPTIGPETTIISGWFGADLYVKPSGSPPPTGPSDRYLGYCPTPTNPCSGGRFELYKWIKSFDGMGLASGESFVVTYAYVLPDAGLQWLYVQADPFWNGGADPDPQWGSSAYGRIDETDEQNNIYGPVSINVQSGKVYLPIVMKNR